MNDIQSLPQALIDTAAKIVSEGSEYHDFFAKAMKKFGITSPSELKGDKEKEFYDYIDKNWKGKGEKKEESKCGEGKCGEGKSATKKEEKKSEKKSEEKKEEHKCGEGKCGGQ